MRRWVLIVLTIALIGVLVVGVTSLLGIPVTSDIAPEQEREPTMVELSTGQELWTYYSASPGDFEQRSAINIVIANATTSDVVSLLAEDASWLETETEEGDAGSEAFSFGELDPGHHEQPLGWGQAVGTERFVYTAVEDEGHWLDESAQLHDGDYYGTRDHLRLYELPGEHPAVAIQAHSEHFDWFTLRHTVTSVEQAQKAVERDLMAVLGVEQVTRIFLGNDTVYDSDGWATFVAALLPLLFVFSSARTRVHRAPVGIIAEHFRDRIEPIHLVLAGTMVAIIFGVRLAGIGLERYTDLSVYMIAILLFPFIFIGIPLAAYALGRQFIARMDAAMSASIGLATAIILDYLYLGLAVLPIETILHRGGLVMAVGLVAAGAAAHANGRETAKRFIAGGVALWVLLVALTLFAIL